MYFVYSYVGYDVFCFVYVCGILMYFVLFTFM